MSAVVFRSDEPMSRHLAARVGGPVDRWAVVHDEDALMAAIDALRAEGRAYTILGAGTRTLVRDGGVSGAILRLGTGFLQWQREGDGFVAGGATPLAALAASAASAGLAGLESLGASPGSLGAAVALDGEAAWRSALTAVRFLPSRGKIRWGTPEEAVGARVVLGARFALLADRPEAVTARTQDALRGPGSGSWWVPPRRATARRVIERAGLFDVRVRDVWLPAAAPDLLVNLGNATARDVQLVLTAACDRISRETGLDLAPRVRWTGRAA